MQSSFLRISITTLLGAFLLYTALFKLLYPGEATMALMALDIPYPMSFSLVTFCIVAEFYLGVMMMLQIDLRIIIPMTAGLLFLFTIYLWYLSTLASPPSCGCLGLSGVFSSNKHAAFFGVIRNCILLLLLKIAYSFTPRSIPTRFEAASASA